MATGTLSTEISLTLGGKEIGFGSLTMDIADVSDANNKSFFVPAANEVVFANMTKIGSGGFKDNIKMVIFKNLDDTTAVRIRVAETAGNTIDYEVPSGGALCLYNRDINVHTASGAFATFSNADEISLQSRGEDPVEVEYLIASVYTT